MGNRQPRVTLENDKAVISNSALSLNELKPGQHYWCILAKRRVLYNEIRLFRICIYRYIVWYDKDAGEYRRDKVVGNQLRNIANTDTV